MFKDRDQLISRGALRMWAEVFEKSQESKFPLQLLPSNSIEEYELRFVVWKVKNIQKPVGDKIDISVQIRVSQNNHESEDNTDIHYNSRDGKGVFNYRFVERLFFPNKYNRISLKILKNNTLSNEVKGELIIDLTSYLRNIRRTKSKIKVKKCWERLSGEKKILFIFFLILIFTIYSIRFLIF